MQIEDTGKHYTLIINLHNIPLPSFLLFFFGEKDQMNLCVQCIHFCHHADLSCSIDCNSTKKYLKSGIG